MDPIHIQLWGFKQLNLFVAGCVTGLIRLRC